MAKAARDRGRHRAAQRSRRRRRSRRAGRLRALPARGAGRRGLREGEDEELGPRGEKLASVERLETGRARPSSCCTRRRGAVERLDAAARELERLRAIDAALSTRRAAWPRRASWRGRGVAAARVRDRSRATRIGWPRFRGAAGADQPAQAQERRSAGGRAGATASLERELEELDGAARSHSAAAHELLEKQQRAAAERDAVARAAPLTRPARGRPSAGARGGRTWASLAWARATERGHRAGRAAPARRRSGGADAALQPRREAKPLARIGRAASCRASCSRSSSRCATPITVSTYVFDEVDAGMR